MHQPRDYRNTVADCDLPRFSVRVKETDLAIYAPVRLKDRAQSLVLDCRGQIEKFIERHPVFYRSLVPVDITGPAPSVVREMSRAGHAAGVGPMAAVAGAVAQYVGNGLLERTPEVIVENGGDLFLKTSEDILIGIYAGQSPLSMKLGLRTNSSTHPVAVCTSSGTIGHSKSLGRADAVCVCAPSCPLADAAATAIGNRVASADDVSKAIGYGKTIPGISGILVIIGEQMGVWGDMALVPLSGKKG